MVTRGESKSFARLGLGSLVVVLGLALALVLALIAVPIELDISAHKAGLEELLTSSLGMPVTVEELHLRTSLQPTFTANGIVVGAAEGGVTPYLSRLERLEVRISLLPLLREQLLIRQIRAADLTVHLAGLDAVPEVRPESSELGWILAELGDTEIDRIRIVQEDRKAGKADLIVERLNFDIADNRALDLTLRGRHEGEPYSLTVGGPTLGEIFPLPTSLPLSFELEISDLVVGGEGAVGDGRIDLHEFEGRIGSTAFRGDLSFVAQEPRPRLEGRVAFDRLDLEAWFAPNDERESAPTEPIDLAVFTRFDGNVELAVEAIDGLPFELTGIATGIRLEDGALTAPLAFTLAGIPISGELGLDVRAETPAVTATGRAEDVTVEQLRAFVDIDDRLSGKVALASISASTRGSTPSDLMKGWSAVLELREARIELAGKGGDPPLRLDLPEARITHRAALPLTLAAEGLLREIPFDLELQTASLDDLAKNPAWPIELRARSAGAVATLEGVISPHSAPIDLELDGSLAGDRLGDLLQEWLGLAGRDQLAFELRGHLSSAGSDRRLEIEEARVGRSRFRGEAAWQTGDAERPAALALHAATLDPGELRMLFGPATRPDSDAGALDVDLPTLPDRLGLRPFDLELAVDRLLRETADLTDISASIRSRDGDLQSPDFSFDYGPSRFEGAVHLDLRQQPPHFTLSLLGRGNALASALSQEKILDDFPISAGGLSLAIDAVGNTPKEMVRAAEISGDLAEVRFQIRLPAADQPLPVELRSVRLNGSKGGSVVLQSDGLLGAQPITARLELGAPDALPGELGKSFPFDLEVEAAAADLRIGGEVRLPLAEGPSHLRIELSGASLEPLSALFGRPFPDLGPYRLQTALEVAEDSLALSDTTLQIADSNLSGSVTYRNLEGRPTLTADLSSPLLRARDLFPGPQSTPDEEPGASPRGPAADTPPREFGESGRYLDLLGRFDAAIRLDIEQLETRQGPLANVSMRVDIDRGTVDAALEGVQGNGAPGTMTLRLEPDGNEVTADLTIHWTRQKYGLAADLLSPEDQRGTWSLTADLSTRGSDFDQWLSALSGHLDFTDYPEDQKATILDLWGSGLVNSVLPAFGLAQASRLNCVLGQFQVEQGIVTPELLILDATRSRVFGKGSIDLPANQMKLHLKPRPKQRRLINLAAPILVVGPVDSPSIKVEKGGLALTFFRLSLWAVTVWHDLFRKPLPTDGSDVCIDPLSRID